ncbi:unnamed protein product [Caretta caretta]
MDVYGVRPAGEGKMLGQDSIRKAEACAEGRTDAAGEASLCSAFPRGAVPGHRVSPAPSVSLVLRTSRPQRANLLTRGKAAQLVAWLHPSRGLCWSLAEPDITRGQT